MKINQCNYSSSYPLNSQNTERKRNFFKSKQKSRLNDSNTQSIGEFSTMSSSIEYQNNPNTLNNSNTFNNPNTLNNSNTFNHFNISNTFNNSNTLNNSNTFNNHYTMEKSNLSTSRLFRRRK